MPFTSPTDDIAITDEAGVRLIRMNRAAKKNALTRAMYDAMTAALADASADAGIGAVLFAGAGGSFCAGNDIADFLQLSGDFTDAPPMRFVKALATFDKPMVAAVEGVAVGIGTTLLLHTDLAYAAPTAMFRTPFVDLALVPEAASSLLLPQRVGMAKAAEILLLADPFGAEEALRLNLVNAILPESHLEARALEAARRLAGKRREALLASRRLMRGDPAVLVARIEEEAVLFARQLGSAEARTVFMAFLAKGKKA
jgi:enoyl-CoA hydratase/carnithine racemase